MLTFTSQKEIKDIFTYLAQQTTNKSQLERLKQKFKSNCIIKTDEELEKRLDTLQNELAEIEEKRDDLTVKLAFLRRDLVAEIKEQIESIKLNFKTEKVENEDVMEFDCQFEEIKDEHGCLIDTLFDKIDKIKGVIESEKRKNEGRVDVFEMAECYFGNINK